MRPKRAISSINCLFFSRFIFALLIFLNYRRIFSASMQPMRRTIEKKIKQISSKYLNLSQRRREIKRSDRDSSALIYDVAIECIRCHGQNGFLYREHVRNRRAFLFIIDWICNELWRIQTTCLLFINLASERVWIFYEEPKIILSAFWYFNIVYVHRHITISLSTTSTLHMKLFAHCLFINVNLQFPLSARIKNDCSHKADGKSLEMPLRSQAPDFLLAN